MPRFFTDALRFDTDTKEAVIDGEDGRHIARSLRMRIGEALTVSDGNGFDYDGEIESISGDTVTVRLMERYMNKSEPTLHVT
ncbi:MAG: 16S rRNA (uracil(1498)-N(3))-methyltransferase, partial [Oscillospiraceae bacterium]|nr:16S rRNA (uracil(1498)-N(3))-methyltransferase [Oscillospiraceae bacterium]